MVINLPRGHNLLQQNTQRLLGLHKDLLLQRAEIYVAALAVSLRQGKRTLTGAIDDREKGWDSKTTRDQLRARLHRFKNHEIDYAARGLCKDLNKMDPVTLDKNHLPIWFEVS